MPTSASNVLQESDEDVLSLLKSATADMSQEERNAFQQRLRSFRPLTYFAKPAVLSPLVCARFGWTNPSTDMLECRKCKAVVAITFHPKLSGEATKKLASAYQTKLCTAHKVTCCFRCSPRAITTSAAGDVPAFLASVLPVDTVDLMEHPAPQNLLQQRVERLEGARPKDKEPLVSVPQEMKKFLNDDDSPEAFVSRVQDALVGKRHDEWAVLLALLGWEPVQDDSSSSMEVHCTTCLARKTLELIDMYEQEDTPERPTKKQRIESMQCPISSHRHYCPFVCGFPTNESQETLPMWKVIGQKVLRKESKQLDQGADAMIQIHSLLTSGLK